MGPLFDTDTKVRQFRSLPLLDGVRGRLKAGWVVMVLVLMGCDMTQESIGTFPPSPPLTAVPLEGDGSYEVRMDSVVNTLRQALEPLVGDLRFTHYRLSNDSSWETVQRHYSQALSGSWTTVQGIPIQGRAYKAKAWRNDDQALLVAFIENPTPANPSSFGILLVAIAGNR